MIKVYIASPYTIGDNLENVKVQILAANLLLDAGLSPYMPLYTHYLEEIKERSYDQWMNFDYDWLAVCDALVRLPGESMGADDEVSFAKDHDIPIFYSIEEVIIYYSKR